MLCDLGALALSSNSLATSQLVKKTLDKLLEGKKNPELEKGTAYQLENRAANEGLRQIFDKTEIATVLL